MKVLFVNPPRSPHNNILAHASQEALPFIHRKLSGPPLGLLTVATAVEDICDVVFLEMKGEYDLNPDTPPPKQLLGEYIDKHRPDVVALTTIASEHNAAMDLLSTAKEIDPEIITVAGGLHATLCGEDYQDSPADVVFEGQAAWSFREMIVRLQRGRPLDHIPSIRLREGGTLQPAQPTSPTLEPAGRDYIRPNRSLLKRWIGTYVVGRSTDPGTYLYTSLGCPYRCTFCSIWPGFSGTYQKRQVESIISELGELDDYPVVRFADANTLYDVPFIDRLFSRIEEEGIKKFFVMDLRTDAVVSNPALIEKLARNGLKVVISGFESFRDKELRRYNKSTKENLIREAIHIMHQNGIMIRGNYVVPPDYDQDDFRALADYAGSHRVAYAGYTILSPMPGTVLHKTMKEQIIDWDLDKYNFFNAVLRTKLPLEKFYENVSNLWIIKRGTDVI